MPRIRCPIGIARTQHKKFVGGETSPINYLIHAVKFCLMVRAYAPTMGVHPWYPVGVGWPTREKQFRQQVFKAYLGNGVPGSAGIEDVRSVFMQGIGNGLEELRQGMGIGSGKRINVSARHRKPETATRRDARPCGATGRGFGTGRIDVATGTTHPENHRMVNLPMHNELLIVHRESSKVIPTIDYTRIDTFISDNTRCIRNPTGLAHTATVANSVPRLPIAWYRPTLIERETASVGLDDFDVMVATHIL